MEWQPIETAPLGRYLLLYGDPWDNSYSPFGVGRGKRVTHEWWEQESRDTQRLKVQTLVEWEIDGLIPEFWAELPPPPEQGQVQVHDPRDP